MKKEIILVCLAVLLLPSIFALNLHVQDNSTNLTYVKGIGQPVRFTITVANTGNSDNFKIYNLVGFIMTPDQPVSIASGEKKAINITAIPVGKIDTGYYTLNYFIQGSSGDKIPESVTFKVVDLSSAFLVGASDVDPKSTSTDLFIKNKANFYFNNLTVKFNSPFFTTTKQFSLAPYEQKNFNVSVSRTNSMNLVAGFYTISADVSGYGGSGIAEGSIKFSQKDILNTTEKDYGFIIFTKEISKTNQGNVVVNSNVQVKKNVISRLFTSFSPAPDSVDRKGLSVYYTWNAQIQPGETQTVTVRTNWILPVIIILLIIGIVVFVKQYSRGVLNLDKRVSFLKARGGEFAVKVSITVSARKFVDRVTITDRLPPLVKLYERFGNEQPRKIDVKNRRLEWYFNSIQPGETWVLSYVIYSKVGVLGRFALPTAVAIFEKDGKVMETESNRAYMVSEQKFVIEED